MLTLDAARNEVNQMQVTDQLIRLDGMKVSYLGDGKLNVETDSGKYVTDWKKGARMLADHTGIDGSYFKEYEDEPELITKMIEHSLSKRSNKTVRLITSGSSLWEVFTKDYPWMPPHRTFDTVFETIQSKLPIMGVQAVGWDQDLRCSIKFVTEENKQPSVVPGTHNRVNDFSHTGVWLRCNGKVETSAYLYRLVCSNGAMVEHRRATHRTYATMDESIRQNTLLALNDSRKLLDEFVNLAERKAPNPSAFITHVARVNRYPDRMIADIVERLPALPPNPTMYDVVNTVTAIAHESEDNPDQFDWFGGSLIRAYNDKCCSQCARTLAA